MTVLNLFIPKTKLYITCAK